MPMSVGAPTDPEKPTSPTIQIQSDVPTEEPTPRINVGSFVQYENKPYIVVGISEETSKGGRGRKKKSVTKATIIPAYEIPQTKETSFIYRPIIKEQLVTYPNNSWRIVKMGKNPPIVMIDPVSLAVNSTQKTETISLDMDNPYLAESLYVGLQLTPVFSWIPNAPRYFDRGAYTMEMPDEIDIHYHTESPTIEMTRDALLDLIDIAINNLDMIRTTTPENPKLKIGSRIYDLSNLRIEQSAQRAINQLQALKSEIEKLPEKQIIEVTTPLQLAAYEQLEQSLEPQQLTVPEKFEQIYSRLQEMLVPEQTSNEQTIERIQNWKKMTTAPAKMSPPETPSFTKLANETAFSKTLRNIIKASITPSAKEWITDISDDQLEQLAEIVLELGRVRVDTIQFPFDTAKIRTLMRYQPEKAKESPLERYFTAAAKHTIHAKLERMLQPLINNQQEIDQLLLEILEKTLSVITRYSKPTVFPIFKLESGIPIQIGTTATTSPRILFHIVSIDTADNLVPVGLIATVQRGSDPTDQPTIIGDFIPIRTYNHINIQKLLQSPRHKQITEVPLSDLTPLEIRSPSPLIRYANELQRTDKFTMERSRFSSVLLLMEYFLRKGVVLYTAGRFPSAKQLVIPIRYENWNAVVEAVRAGLSTLNNGLRGLPGAQITDIGRYTQYIQNILERLVSYTSKPDEEEIKNLFDPLYEMDVTLLYRIPALSKDQLGEIIDSVIREFYSAIPLKPELAAPIAAAQIGHPDMVLTAIMEELLKSITATSEEKPQTEIAEEETEGNIIDFLIDGVRSKENFMEAFGDESIVRLHFVNLIQEGIRMAFTPDQIPNTYLDRIREIHTLWSDSIPWDDPASAKAGIISGYFAIEMYSPSNSQYPQGWTDDDIKTYLPKLYTLILKRIGEITLEDLQKEVIEWVSYSQAEDGSESPPGIFSIWTRTSQALERWPEKAGTRYFKRRIHHNPIQLLSASALVRRMVENSPFAVFSGIQFARPEELGSPEMQNIQPAMLIGTPESTPPSTSAEISSVGYQHIGQNALRIGLGLLPNIMQNVGALSRHLNKLLETEPDKRIVSIDIGTAILKGDIADVILVLLGGLPAPLKHTNRYFTRYPDVNTSSPDVRVPIIEIPNITSITDYKNALKAALGSVSLALGGQNITQQDFILRIPNILVHNKERNIIDRVIQKLDAASDDDTLKSSLRQDKEISRLIFVPQILPATDQEKKVMGDKLKVVLKSFNLADELSAKDAIAILLMQIYSFAAIRLMTSLGQALPLEAWKDVLSSQTIQAIERLKKAPFMSDALYIPLFTPFLSREVQGARVQDVRDVSVSFHALPYHDDLFARDSRSLVENQARTSSLALRSIWFLDEEQRESGRVEDGPVFPRAENGNMTQEAQKDKIRLMRARTAMQHQALLSRTKDDHISISQGFYLPAITLEMRLLAAGFLSRYLALTKKSKEMSINVSYISQIIGTHFGIDILPTINETPTINNNFGDGDVSSDILIRDLNTLILFSAETAFRPDIRETTLPTVQTEEIPPTTPQDRLDFLKTTGKNLRQSLLYARHHVVHPVPKGHWELFSILKKEIGYAPVYQANQPGGLLVGFANVLQRGIGPVLYLGLLSAIGRTIISLDPGMLTMLGAILGGVGVLAVLVARLSLDRSFRKAMYNSLVVLCMAFTPERFLNKLTKELARTILEENARLRLQEQEITQTQQQQQQTEQPQEQQTQAEQQPQEQQEQQQTQEQQQPKMDEFGWLIERRLHEGEDNFRIYLLKTMLTTMRSSHLLGSTPGFFMMRPREFINSMAYYEESPILISGESPGYATIQEILRTFDTIIEDLNGMLADTKEAKEERTQSPDLLFSRILRTHLALAEMFYLLGDGNMEAHEIRNGQIVYRLGHLPTTLQYDEVAMIYFKLLMHTIGQTGFTNRFLDTDLEEWGIRTLSFANGIRNVLKKAIAKETAFNDDEKNTMNSYLQLIKIFPHTADNNPDYIILGRYETPYSASDILDQILQNENLRTWDALVNQFPGLQDDIRTLSELYLLLLNKTDQTNLPEIMNSISEAIRTRKQTIRTLLEKPRTVIRSFPLVLILYHLGEDHRYVETYARLLMFKGATMMNAVYDYNQALHAIIGSLLYGGEADIIHAIEPMKGHLARSYPPETMLSIQTEQAALMLPRTMLRNNPISLLITALISTGAGILNLPERTMNTIFLKMTRENPESAKQYESFLKIWSNFAGTVLLFGIPFLSIASGITGPLIGTILANPVTELLATLAYLKLGWSGIRKIRPTMGTAFEYTRYVLGRASSISSIQEVVSDFLRKAGRGIMNIRELKEHFAILKRYHGFDVSKIAAIEEHLSGIRRNWQQFENATNLLVQQIYTVSTGLTSLGMPGSQEFYRTSRTTLDWWKERIHTPLLTPDSIDLNETKREAASNIKQAITDLGPRTRGQIVSNMIIAESLFGPAFMIPYETISIKIPIPTEIENLLDERKSNGLKEALKEFIRKYLTVDATRENENPNVIRIGGYELSIIKIEDLDVEIESFETTQTATQKSTEGGPHPKTTFKNIVIRVPILDLNYVSGIVYETVLMEMLSKIDEETRQTNLATEYEQIMTAIRSDGIPSKDQIKQFLNELEPYWATIRTKIELGSNQPGIENEIKNIYREYIVPKYARLLAAMIGHATTASPIITNILSEEYTSFEQTPLYQAATTLQQTLEAQEQEGDKKKENYKQELRHATEIVIFIAEKANQIIHEIGTRISRQIDPSARIARANLPAGIRMHPVRYQTPIQELIETINELGSKLPELTTDLEKIVKRLEQKQKMLMQSVEEARKGWEAQVAAGITKWLQRLLTANEQRRERGGIMLLPPHPLISTERPLRGMNVTQYIRLISDLILDEIKRTILTYIGTLRDESFRASLALLQSGISQVIGSGHPDTLNTITYLLLENTRFLPDGYITDPTTNEIIEIDERKIESENKSAEAIGKQLSTLINDILQLFTPSLHTEQQQGRRRQRRQQRTYQTAGEAPYTGPTLEEYSMWDADTVERELSDTRTLTSTDEPITPIAVISSMIRHLNIIDRNLSKRAKPRNVTKQAISNLKNFLIHTAYAMMHQKIMESISTGVTNQGETNYMRLVGADAHEYYFHASMVRTMSESALYHLSLFIDNIFEIAKRPELMNYFTNTVIASIRHDETYLADNKIADAIRWFLVYTLRSINKMLASRQESQTVEDTDVDINRSLELVARIEEMLADIDPSELTQGNDEFELEEEHSAQQPQQAPEQDAQTQLRVIIDTQGLPGLPEHVANLIFDRFRETTKTLVRENANLPRNAFSILTLDLLSHIDPELKPPGLSLELRSGRMLSPLSQLVADSFKQRIDELSDFSKSMKEFLRSYYKRLSSIFAILAAETVRTAHRARTLNSSLNFLIDQIARAPAFVLSLWRATGEVIWRAFDELVEFFTHPKIDFDIETLRTKRIPYISRLLWLYALLMIGSFSYIGYQITQGHPNPTAVRISETAVPVAGAPITTITQAMARATETTRQQVGEGQTSMPGTLMVATRSFLEEMLGSTSGFGANIGLQLFTEIASHASHQLFGSPTRTMPLSLTLNAPFDHVSNDPLALRFFLHYTQSTTPLAVQSAVRSLAYEKGYQTLGQVLIGGDYNLNDLLNMTKHYFFASVGVGPYSYYNNRYAPAAFPRTLSVRTDTTNMTVLPLPGALNPTNDVRAAAFYPLIPQTVFDIKGTEIITQFRVPETLDSLANLARYPDSIPNPVISIFLTPSPYETKEYQSLRRNSPTISMRNAQIYLDSLASLAAKLYETLYKNARTDFLYNAQRVLLESSKREAGLNPQQWLTAPDGKQITDESIMTAAAVAHALVTSAIDVEFRSFKPIERVSSGSLQGYPISETMPIQRFLSLYEPPIIHKKVLTNPIIANKIHNNLREYFFITDHNKYLGLTDDGTKLLITILDRLFTPIDILTNTSISTDNRFAEVIISRLTSDTPKHIGGINTRFEDQNAILFLINYEAEGIQQRQRIIAIVPENQQENSLTVYLFIPSRDLPTNGLYYQITYIKNPTELTGQTTIQPLKNSTIDTFRASMALALHQMFRPLEDLHAGPALTALLMYPTPTFSRIYPPDAPDPLTNKSLLYNTIRRILQEHYWGLEKIVASKIPGGRIELNKATVVAVIDKFRNDLENAQASATDRWTRARIKATRKKLEDLGKYQSFEQSILNTAKVIYEIARRANYRTPDKSKTYDTYLKIVSIETALELILTHDGVPYATPSGKGYKQGPEEYDTTNTLPQLYMITSDLFSRYYQYHRGELDDLTRFIGVYIWERAQRARSNLFGGIEPAGQAFEY
jgi:hypothetical protein